MKEKVTRRKRELEGILSPEDFRKVDRLSANTAEYTFNRARLLHKEKLEKLTKHKTISLSPEGASRWVVNRTEHQPTPAHEEVLALGLNFTPTPTSIPLKDIASAIDGGAKKLLDSNLAHHLRGRVCGEEGQGPQVQLDERAKDCPERPKGQEGRCHSAGRQGERYRTDGEGGV